MAWIPKTSWLTKVGVDGEASQLSFDLAIDASGAGRPSAIDAGLAMPGDLIQTPPVDLSRLFLALAFAGLGIAGIGLIMRAGPITGRPAGW